MLRLLLIVDYVFWIAGGGVLGQWTHLDLKTLLLLVVLSLLT